jgi:hypothetical protein
MLLATRIALPAGAESYISLTDVCERYSVRVFMIGERRSNAGRSRLYSLGNEIWGTRQSETRDDVVHAKVSRAVEEVASLARFYASDEATFAALSDPQRNWYAKPGHKWFLYQYELHLLGAKVPAFKFEDFIGVKRTQTTEHILPQNPGTTGWSQFSEPARTRLTHCLGNLVLTFDNSVYSNHGFRRKRDGDKANPGSPCYRTSILLQERELTRWDEWQPSSVVERQEMLATWAMVRWALPQVLDPSAQPTEAEALADATDVEESAVDKDSAP